VEPGKRPSLTRLVQMIGEIVAQGEDSGSQSQASGDGGLRAKLRTVLLSLLDGIMGDNAGKRGQRGSPPPVAARFERQAGGGRDVACECWCSGSVAMPLFATRCSLHCCSPRCR
jgi:hypothetical protein